MNITVDIIRDILSDSCEVTQYGRSLHGCPLRIPRFYNAYSPVEEGGVYILRSCDLPGDLREKCLFICFDAPPVLQHYRCQSEILYLHGDNLNYLSIMNTVQGIFDRLLTWQDKMQKIVNTDCDIEKMVQKSIPVFENRITIIDYNLNILAYCESRTVDGILYDEMNCSVRQVPKQKSFLFNLEGRREIYLHEPYHIPEPDTGIDNYCINLFLDNEYMGTCALMQDNRPIRPSDYLLFQQFAAFVNATISRQSSRAGDKYVTLKDLLRRLLDSMPVSRLELNTALGKSDLGGDKKIQCRALSV